MTTAEIQARGGGYLNDYSFLANRNDLARRYLPCGHIILYRRRIL